MTAKQRQARERFKKVVQEASKLRKKNKNLTQAQAVKQAWAIQYSKEGKSIKGDQLDLFSSAPKKSRTKRSATYQRGTSNIEKDKKRQALAPGKRKSASGRTYYEYRANRSDAGKLLGTKHTDTKSHNVNIRVLNGINKYIQVVFTRYKLKYGKRVLKNTPLEIIVIGMPQNINPEKFGKPIISQGIMIYKSAKEKFNYGNEKGELIRYLVPDDENYQKGKSAAKLSAYTELFL